MSTPVPDPVLAAREASSRSRVAESIVTSMTFGRPIGKPAKRAAWDTPAVPRGVGGRRHGEQ